MHPIRGGELKKEQIGGHSCRLHLHLPYPTLFKSKDVNNKGLCESDMIE